MTKIGWSADKRGGEGVSPLPAEFHHNCHKKLSDFPLRYSKGKDRQVGWVKETDKITFTNSIHNFDLKYLGVKSSYVKIRQQHNVVDFKICVARDDDKMYL